MPKKNKWQKTLNTNQKTVQSYKVGQTKPKPKQPKQTIPRDVQPASTTAPPVKGLHERAILKDIDLLWRGRGHPRNEKTGGAYFYGSVLLAPKTIENKGFHPKKPGFFVAKTRFLVFLGPQVDYIERNVVDR